MSISQKHRAQFTYLTDRQLRYFETYGWGDKGVFPYILKEEANHELPANPKIKDMVQAITKDEVQPVTNEESQNIATRQQKHEDQIILANNIENATIWEEVDTYDDTWESGRL